MIIFKYVRDGNNIHDISDIKFKVDGSVSYSELVEQFKLFCLAMGFSSKTVSPEEEE